jgi:hypothetical protein
MACIGGISASLAMPCGAPARADLNRPVSAKILNAAAIASFTVGPGSVATITRVPGKVGYDVTVDNKSLVVTVGLKSQDIIPGAYDVAITFKSFSGVHTLVSEAAPGGVVDKLSRAELVIAVDHGDAIRVYGLGVPLVCTEMSGDSSASAYVTYTFGVEDWQVGTTIHYMNRKDYVALNSPAE